MTLSIPTEALGINLLKELGIEDMPLVQKEKFLMDVTVVINQNIALKLLETLPQERTKELEELLTKSVDPEKIQMFFRQEVPNFDELVRNEVAAYKASLLERFKELKGQ